MSAPVSNVRPRPDKVLTDIADYVAGYRIASRKAFDTARLCLMDTLGCGLEALEYPACTKLLGPVVAGTVVPDGANVPGTSYQLDPVMAQAGGRPRFHRHSIAHPRRGQKRGLTPTVPLR